jgi:hypothetical protein
MNKRKIVVVPVDAIPLDMTNSFKAPNSFFHLAMVKQEGSYYLSPPLELFVESSAAAFFNCRDSNNKWFLNCLYSEANVLAPAFEEILRFRLPDIPCRRRLTRFTKDRHSSLPFFHHAYFTDVDQSPLLRYLALLNEQQVFFRGSSKYLIPFRTFCCWLSDPAKYQDPVNSPEYIPFGDELDTLTLPSATCPFLCKTLEDRLFYLWEKGRSAVCEASNRKAKLERTGKLTQYDNFVLWYVENQELPLLKTWLPKVMYPHYVCLRWLPWRKPLTLKKYTDKWKSQVLPEEAWYPADEALMLSLCYARDHFPPPFVEVGTCPAPFKNL